MPSRGREEQNVVLTLVVAFLVIMLLELDERFPQRTFPEQDQMGQALLFNRSHSALLKTVQIRAARRQSETLHAPCCQGLPELSAELGIAIVQGVRTGCGQNWYIEQRLARQARASPEVSTKRSSRGPNMLFAGCGFARRILSYLALFRNVLILAVSCPYPQRNRPSRFCA